MENYILGNGVQIPAVGFGTYKSTEGSENTVIADALKVGYRHFDTAAYYGNEKILGTAFKSSGIPRRELFLTSKVWRGDLGYESTLHSFRNSLENLQTDYLDLYLIHWPTEDPVKDWETQSWRKACAETWKALEKLYREGLVRAIGVSNFLPHHLLHLMDNAQEQPMVNQLEYHPGYTQQGAVSFCQDHHIQVSAWSPLGRSRVMQDPLLLELADKYGKSVAQICLRFALQNHILPLPKASSPRRMENNLQVFDFQISREDMFRLMTMPPTGWSGEHPDRVRIPV